MISEDRMKHMIIVIKQAVSYMGSDNDIKEDAYEAIDLIPLGWQVANRQEDSRVGVALESDDSN